MNLSLLTGDRKENQNDVTYEAVIEMLSNEQNIARIAFIGEAGVGKTTLLAKIAYEWALGRQLHETEILLYVPLREFQTGTHVANILQMYIARGIGFDNQVLENFMRAEQRRVTFLLDGLDEYVGDIRNADHADALIGIMRGDEYKRSPVIVTTRPWKAQHISSTPTLELRYSLVAVKGFKKDDVRDYVKKFFQDDPQAANSLIDILTDDSLVAQNMSPYPIFCCMLCNMWKTDSKRDTIKALETFADLFEEMINSLVEHSLVKKYTRDYRKRYQKCLEQIGQIALEGLLNDKLTFAEHAFTDCMDSMETACELGILSSEKRFKPTATETDETQLDICFSHKLFQEYLSGLYLSSLYIVNQANFWTLVKDNFMIDHKKFRYLLYFTVARGKEPGYAGKPLMDLISTEIDDEEFLVDVAFECHEELAISPIVDYFQKKCTHLQLSTRIQVLKKHTWSGYMHVLGLCGREMVSQKLHTLYLA